MVWWSDHLAKKEVVRMNINELYEKFKEKFEANNGECYRVGRIAEIKENLINILSSKNCKNISLYESPLSRTAGLVTELIGAGLEVHTDDLLHNTKTDDVGITEVNWGIAELGTLVQIAPEVDNRLCSTLVPIHVALLKTENLIPDLDSMLDVIDNLPQIPGFVGFITGPSRSSDIERILEIGVHGPKQVIAILVDE